MWHFTTVSSCFSKASLSAHTHTHTHTHTLLCSLICSWSPPHCRSCTDPNPIFFPNRWLPSDITTWPICRTQDENQTEPSLTCDLTGRPCCIGIQANCRITTREECDYLFGRFHQDAFLCSQVGGASCTFLKEGGGRGGGGEGRKGKRREEEGREREKGGRQRTA